MGEKRTSAAHSKYSTQQFPGAPSLSLTFLFAGIGFSLPILLFPEIHPLNGKISSEILNLNFLVAWMGLAHFVFAFHGQGKYLRHTERRGTVLFFSGLIASASVLLLLKGVSDSRIFDFVIWIYFIPHFIKAELHFAQTGEKPVQRGWVLYWFPALAFAFLTFALFGPKELAFNTSILIALAILCVAAGAMGGIGRQLYSANAKYTLLAFFFIGEALVWGTYSKYMTPQFRQGVYVFHIAAASFYHYFRSYGFALRKQPTPVQIQRYLGTIILVNLMMLGIGLFTVYRDGHFLGFVFDVQNFTFWVGLHLVASDLFAVVRKLNKGR